MNDIIPPICFICKKNFEKKVDSLYYCICDISLCEECINSVKSSNNQWSCPKCGTSNKIKDSRLFREKKKFIISIVLFLKASLNSLPMMKTYYF